MAKRKEETKKKTIPGAVFVEDLKKEQKVTKKKENDQVGELSKKMSEIKVTNTISGEQIEADLKMKKIRKLKKTLREIEQIEEKLKAGQQIEKEQLEKLKKKESIFDELKSLGEEPF